MAKRPIKRNGLLTDFNNNEHGHIGGDSPFVDTNVDYVDNQKNIINNRMKNIPKSFRAPYEDMQFIPYDFNVYNSDRNINSTRSQNKNTEVLEQQNVDRYDHTTDFLYKNGLIDRDNDVRYDIHYYNIDSSRRVINPSISTNDPILLNYNPLMITESSSDGLVINTQIEIYIKDHNFVVNDLITLSGVMSPRVILRTLNELGQTPFIFTTGSDYLTVNFPNASQIMESIYDGSYNGFPWTDNDKNSLYVSFSGFSGTSSNNQFIGNIPINSLNCPQQIYLELPLIPFDPDKFYIKLIKQFDTLDPLNLYIYVFPLPSYNITIYYLYSSGIPNNLINADYPIGLNQIQGFLTIIKKEKNYIYVDIPRRMGNIEKFGGSAIYIAKVIMTYNGFPYPNQYTIYLGKLLINVIYASIISTQFPNSQQLIKSNPPSHKNNMFYWQNIDDGDYLYSVQITDGNYTLSSLSNLLQNLIYTVPKYNYNNINTKYTDKNYMKITLDNETNIFTAKSYKQAILMKPFVLITSLLPISSDGSSGFNIQIFHEYHNISVGTQILISGSISTCGIPDNLLNSQFTVQSIIDANNYTIQLPSLNLLSDITDTKGGNVVTIFVPNVFRLRADFSDSILKILGFRDVGKNTSITLFETVVTNNEPYDSEILIDIYGQLKSFKNLSFDFDDINYIEMICPQLGLGTNIDNSITNILTKIQLSKIHGKIVYNTFVYMPHTYFDPISELYQLDFSFVNDDNSLYDFNGIDHSFIIKIVTLDDHPKGTSMNTSIGKFT